MSERIEVGDLVMVVRPPRHVCKCSEPIVGAIGKIFRVLKISRTTYHCAQCKFPLPPTIVAWASFSPPGTVYKIGRLKKIPPLHEPESVTEGERTEA